MKTPMHRRWAFAMLILELIATVVFFKTYVIPFTVGLLGLIGYLRQVTFQSSLRRVVIFSGLLLLVPYFRITVFPIEIGQFSSTMGEYGLVATEYALILQLLLFHWERRRVDFGVFCILGGLVIMCQGDRYVNPSEYALYQSTVFIYLICLAGMAQEQSRRIFVTKQSRAGALLAGTMMFVVVVASSGISLGLYRYHSELDDLAGKLAFPFADMGGIRMDTESQLGAVAKTKIEGKTKVALRIISDEAPGYLRANAFDNYEPPRWLNSTPVRALRKLEDGSAQEGYRRYPLVNWSPSQVASEDMALRDIWPTKGVGPTVFTQLHAPYVEIDDALVYANGHGIATSRDRIAGSNYRLYIDSEKHSLPPIEIMKARMLELPSNLDPEVRALADALFEDADSPLEKALRVVGHFQKNHTYALGIEIPPGVDPLTYFLLERPPAHCEYFATGAAVLLRLGGVPCRYVTGYVVREQSDKGGYWLARSRDAHAWVEAWDEEEGWVVIEATPASGVPQGEGDAETSYAWDAWKFRFQQWREALMSGRILQKMVEGIRVLAGWIGSLVMRPIGIAVVVLIALGYAARAWMKRLRERTQAGVALDDLGLLLRRMDDFLSGQGTHRRASETLEQFTERIHASETMSAEECERVRAWYKTYSERRYDPSNGSETVTASLTTELTRLVEPSS
ncbi:MAG: transglutaminase-like domain-containing protein [Candidatus Hydrogenedentota bacterium]